MQALVAAVVLVGVLGVLNLLFTFGVVRRLREHSELITQGAGGTAPGGAGAPSLAVGTQVGDFTGVTRDGDRVSREQLTGETVVAFLTPGCAPCAERLPGLVDLTAGWPGGRSRTLVVVVAGDAGAAGEYVEALVATTRVVLESPGGALATAFGVQGYPVFGVVDGSGVVLRSTMDPAELRVRGQASV